jgi:methionyl-tRNA formyltransferase
MTPPSARAVVFAYHNIGVRGLAVLLALGVDVRLVVTHRDDPQERVWFNSVRALAEANDIAVIMPANPNAPEVVAQIRGCRPHWLFSFYYRHMLKQDLLSLPDRGAYNLHGSLLPKYRGRTPVNWAVLHGEKETGASLHRMVLKPDAGALLDQESVAILPNDTAHDVFQKICCAAEEVLLRAIPKMLAGRHDETPLELSKGSYFGGRRPQDGEIDWSQPAWRVHNLIRAVAPPYPGAYTEISGKRLMVLGSYYRPDQAGGKGPAVFWIDDRCYADCVDGVRLLITRLALEGRDLDRQEFVKRFGQDSISVA